MSDDGRRRSVVAAYDATGGRWQAGPGRVYDRLAEVVVASSPVPVAGLTVLDVGAGTGAASRAVAASGGRPIGLDPARGMLSSGAPDRPPAVQADARHLPFADDRFGAVVAAFSLNHVDDPAGCLREAARVVSPGGAIVASSYAEDDSHPAKAAVEQALGEAGWEPAAWYADLRSGPIAALATAERFVAVGEEAGLSAGCVALRVAFDQLGPFDLVDWRLGMAQHAPFVAELPATSLQAVRERAVALLGDEPPVLERSILVLTAVV